MPTVISPQWQDKAGGFFSASGVKLKEAGHSAGTFVEEVAKDAKENVADVAGRVGSVFKSKWSLFRQPATKHAVQERLITAAASTGFFLRKGFSETKEKVAVGKTKVEEVAKKTALRSKSIISDIERWQKGVASSDVFGIAIEVTVQRQQSSRPIPQILVRCADHLIASGLGTPYLFKVEGDKKAIQQLVSLYNQEPNAIPPENANPLDIAVLIKCYLASLPEPLITFELYDEIKSARSSINVLKNVLKRLPTVNYMTLEFVTALLLNVCQKSVLNKMGAQTLSEEMAPVIIWQHEQRPESYRQFWHRDAKDSIKTANNSAPKYGSWDILEDSDDEDASSPIPLDDGLPIDFAAVEVIRCLIDHHNAIFTDANETIWR
ncbi:putative Rho GTPase-activating protein At5g61530 [Silene latifolia]|uniref:putative Rho GTPase-activating protein At5g61530 n=1 Tax=Silene latifolia TaxID=37657 RepID=UPI003D770250